jgi:hypothetical protein
VVAANDVPIKSLEGLDFSILASSRDLPNTTLGGGLLEYLCPKLGLDDRLTILPV